LKYRLKKDTETWNDYLLNLFREKKEPNFMIFCKNYFSCDKRVEEYQNGIKLDKESKQIEKEKISNKTKTTFAKKPKRLKKGLLF